MHKKIVVVLISLSFAFGALLYLPSTDAIANPASVFCLEHGYSLEPITSYYPISNTQEGSIVADPIPPISGYVCVFPDGTSCEEWSFYNRECGVQWRNDSLSDIQGSTFEVYIRNLFNDGIISGFSDGTFRPNTYVTRGQMAKFIANAFDIRTELGCFPFSDVTQTNTFYEHIMMLKCNGIISGYSDGTYKPNSYITRGQATKYIYNALAANGMVGMEVGSGVDSGFSDVSGDNTFRTYIIFLHNAGVIDGYSDGTFRPNDPLTRGAMAKIVDLARNIHPHPIALKPVIYLYPQTEQDIEVRLDYHGELVADYPDYDPVIGGWDVTAYLDGRLINHADNQEYSYIFWEGRPEERIDWDLSEGFVVKGEDVKVFLQTTLSQMGLTPREYNEFIVFWYPLMKDNAYNLVHFAGKQYTDTAELSISPSPDSMLRVFMVYKPLDEMISIKPQELQPFERQGFTVVEWGGALAE